MGCEKENCCKKERKHDMCDMTSGMMRMADKAWEELMLQKMKSHFDFESCLLGTKHCYVMLITEHITITSRNIFQKRIRNCVPCLLTTS